MDSVFKRSAIHNLRISRDSALASPGDVSEGLVVPRDLLALSDIVPFERVIVANIRSGVDTNRVFSFVIPGDEPGIVEPRGSLSHFLRPGDLICIVATTVMTDEETQRYTRDDLAIFDVGLDPATNKDNRTTSLYIELYSRKIKNAPNNQSHISKRAKRRYVLSSLIQDCVVTETHPDCLQGSAELPAEVMDAGKIRRFESVSVFNRQTGGVADTYAVPMPPGVVMTTGAMARFAPVGHRVNVATYGLSDGEVKPNILFVANNKPVISK
jgi:aspartate 1-decarboxylase